VVRTGKLGRDLLGRQAATQTYVCPRGKITTALITKLLKMQLITHYRFNLFIFTKWSALSRC